MPIINPASSGGNATVPNDAQILPAQAFVDNIALVTADVLDDLLDNGSQYTRLATKGLTGIYYGTDQSTCVYKMFDHLHGNNGILDLAHNAFTQAVVDGVLHLCATDFPHMGIFIDGGTTAIPTGGATNIDAWAVGTHASQANSVNWNVRGGPCGVGNGIAEFAGAALNVTEVNALLAFIKANYLTKAWTLNLDGANAAPTGQGITDKGALITAGWTVVTN